MYEEVLKIDSHRKPYRVVTFDSVYDFSRTKSDRAKCIELLNKDVLAKFQDGDKTSWFGARTEKEVREILERGHPRYADMVRNQFVDIAPPVNIKRRKIQGDHGDELCIHRVNMGNISTAWKRRSPKGRVGAKNIRLLVNIGQSFSVSAEESQWVGVAALAAAEAYERAGYNIAIDAVCGSDGITNDENILFVVPIKSYEAPLDIQSLSSALCFPAFFRWSAFMNFGLANGNIDSGLGCPIDDDVILDKIIRPHYSSASEDIEFISRNCRSKESAEKEISRLIQKYGVPADYAA